MEANGIKHITSAPYHPSTNGIAERGVQTLKQGIRHTKGSSIQEEVSKFLFNYRITPHATAGVAPSELHDESHDWINFIQRFPRMLRLNRKLYMANQSDSSRRITIFV